MIGGPFDSGVPKRGGTMCNRCDLFYADRGKHAHIALRAAVHICANESHDRIDSTQACLTHHLNGLLN